MTAVALADARYVVSPTAGDFSGGVSEFAGRITTEIERTYSDFIRSVTGQHRLADPLRELAVSFDESRELGDSDERVAPSTAAYNEAIELLQSLPSWAPPPMPVMEPSGAIGLEWDFGPGKFFVLAVDGTRRVEYSAILGPGDDHHGTTYFAAMPLRRPLDLLADLLQR